MLNRFSALANTSARSEIDFRAQVELETLRLIRLRLDSLLQAIENQDEEEAAAIVKSIEKSVR